MRLCREIAWLMQSQMVNLFGRDQTVTSRHTRNSFAKGELPEMDNMQEMHIAASSKPLTRYSLTRSPWTTPSLPQEAEASAP